MTKISKAKFKKALKGSAGIRTTIADALRVDRSTVTRYLIRNPEMMEFVIQEEESTTDLAESQLLRGIKQGNSKMIMFRLERKGKDRGYATKQEIEQTTEHRLTHKDVKAELQSILEKQQQVLRECDVPDSDSQEG